MKNIKNIANMNNWFVIDAIANNYAIEGNEFNGFDYKGRLR